MTLRGLIDRLKEEDLDDQLEDLSQVVETLIDRLGEKTREEPVPNNRYGYANHFAKINRLQRIVEYIHHEK